MAKKPKKSVFLQTALRAHINKLEPLYLETALEQLRALLKLQEQVRAERRADMRAHDHDHD